MLSALGALVTWKPVFDFLDVKPDQHANLLFIGFLAILFVIAFIGMYGLLKQSVGHLEKPNFWQIVLLTKQRVTHLNFLKTGVFRGALLFIA
jgi:hypothetical protein